MDSLKYTLAELSETARKIIKSTPGKTLLLHGKMGVGKTTLIKELVKQLGSDDTVSSPTFSLVNEYRSEKDSLFHFDFYRIEDEMEALDIGIEEYFDRDNWIFIEWPEKIVHLLPENAVDLYLERRGSYNLLRLEY